MLKLSLLSGFILASCLIVSCATTEAEPKTKLQKDPIEQPVADLSDPFPEKSAAADEEQICKYSEITGSHIKRKICATQEEWDEIREVSKRFVRDVQNSTSPKRSE